MRARTSCNNRDVSEWQFIKGSVCIINEKKLAHFTALCVLHETAYKPENLNVTKTVSGMFNQFYRLFELGTVYLYEIYCIFLVFI